MADNKELQIELVKVTEELKKHCQCFDCNDGADIQEYVGKFCLLYTSPSPRDS